MQITFRTKGNFKKADEYLKRKARVDLMSVLNSYAQEGVAALSANTPIDSGETAASWGVQVLKKRGGYTIVWTNRHEIDGVNIAVIIQYGHGTGTGGYVQGRDYINPAMRPVFDNIAKKAWKAVISA